VTRRPDNAGWREIFRASLILPTTVVGIVLPLDFISQTDGYVVYLRPWELVPVYAWALLFYLLIGSAASVMAVAIASGTSLVARKKILPAVVVAEAGLAFSVLTLTLVRAGKLWMASHGSIQLATWMSRHQQSIIIFAVIGCFTWAFARGATVRKIEPAARCGGAIGLFVVLLSPVFVFSHNTDIGKSRTMDLPSGNGVAHPNIVLITIDALAANHLSLYGYPRTTSPNLERLAGEADTFDRYYANSNFTTPTVNSFINGVRPWTHRANQPLARVDRRLADQGLVARLKR